MEVTDNDELEENIANREHQILFGIENHLNLSCARQQGDIEYFVGIIKWACPFDYDLVNTHIDTCLHHVYIFIMLNYDAVLSSKGFSVVIHNSVEIK